jgi:hypothetical protein
MKPNFKYDFSISYASPDHAFVAEVVTALQARGLRVFFAPKSQGELIGGALHKTLQEVYGTEARFCLMFVSDHYTKSLWTMEVELPCALDRQNQDGERHIIPVRLDQTKLPGVIEADRESVRVDIRNPTPIGIADHCVAIMLAAEEPAAQSTDDKSQDRLVMRVISLTEFDRELLRGSFQHFKGWLSRNSYMIPVELRLPQFIVHTLEEYEAYAGTPEFEEHVPNTKAQFKEALKLIRREMECILKVPDSVFGVSRPYGEHRFLLTDQAVELIERYVLAKTIAIARCLKTWQLVGGPSPDWASRFADCAPLWTPEVMGGLAWLCRALGEEIHLWIGSNLYEKDRPSDWLRVYIPVSLTLRGTQEPPTAEETLRLLAPQLLEARIEGRTPDLLSDALHYPDRLDYYDKNEFCIECLHFNASGMKKNDGSSIPSRGALEAFRDWWLEAGKSGTVPRHLAIERLNRAESCLNNEELFAPAIKELYALASTKSP